MATRGSWESGGYSRLGRRVRDKEDWSMFSYAVLFLNYYAALTEIKFGVGTKLYTEMKFGAGVPMIRCHHIYKK